MSGPFEVVLANLMEFGESYARESHRYRRLVGVGITYTMDHDFPLITTRRVDFEGVKRTLLYALAPKAHWRYYPDLLLVPDRQDDVAQRYTEGYRYSGGVDMVTGPHAKLYVREVDQIQKIIDAIRTDPYRGDLVLMARTPALPFSAFDPLYHPITQFFAYPLTGNLSLFVYLPFVNYLRDFPEYLAAYSLLLALVAQCTGYSPETVMFSIGQARIRDDDLEAAREIAGREAFPFPTLTLDPQISNIESFTPESIAVEGYEAHNWI